MLNWPQPSRQLSVRVDKISTFFEPGDSDGTLIELGDLFLIDMSKPQSSSIDCRYAENRIN